jgi:predicted enzyme related to lactoylglutathione lyase
MSQNSQPILENLRPITPAGKDIEKAIAFYETELGFKTTWRDPQGNMAVIVRDSAEMMLQQSDDAHWASQTAYLIRTRNVKAMYDECLAKGGKAIHPNGQLKKRPWGTTEFSILDPAGVCITFYEFLD